MAVAFIVFVLRIKFRTIS